VQFLHCREGVGRLCAARTALGATDVSRAGG
jgi:hypothetical protein